MYLLSLIFPVCFVLALHQPPDPAVVAGSESRLPPQQQKNILQVGSVQFLWCDFWSRPGLKNFKNIP